MTTNPDEIRDRLQVVTLDDQISLGDGAILYVEDPHTGCVGLGEVEAEAVGNAISVVIQYESDNSSDTPYVKAPGRVIKKSWADDQTGMLDTVRELL